MSMDQVLVVPMFLEVGREHVPFCTSAMLHVFFSLLMYCITVVLIVMMTCVVKSNDI
jgi:hypothetical protein